MSRPSHFVSDLWFSFHIHLTARMEKNTPKKFVGRISFDRELRLSVPFVLTVVVTGETQG